MKNKLNKWSNKLIIKNIKNIKESSTHFERQIDIMIKTKIDYRKIYELNKELAINDLLITELENELKRRKK